MKPLFRPCSAQKNESGEASALQGSGACGIHPAVDPGGGEATLSWIAVANPKEQAPPAQHPIAWRGGRSDGRQS